MKLLFKLLILVMVTVGISTGCDVKKDDTERGIRVFPKPSQGYVGDPMPFYHDGVLNMYYLHDARDGQIGFHPFNLMTTEDFLEWEEEGTVIPYVKDLDHQDLALGTGSVIQDIDGLYHAFYTGHNYTGNMPYKEKIQHATSLEGKQWVKVEADGFFGEQDDFRDPYVIYMKEMQEYWMLVTTRSNGKAVLKKYTSTDLSVWEDKGIFFENPQNNNNMECATLIYYNGYWYLSYSLQGAGNERVFRYHYKKTLDDSWISPENNYIDGIGFYAGRLEKFGDRLMVSGWVGTKEADYDGGNFNWAGNLVNHELVQKEDGTLMPRMILEIDEILSRKVKPQIVSTLGADYRSSTVTYPGERDFETIVFEPFSEGATKIEFTVTMKEPGSFGLAFDVDHYYGNANIHCDTKNGRIEFYNVSTKMIGKETPQFSLDYDFSNQIHVKGVVEGTCMTFYMNDEIAVTTRIYEAQGNPFGIYTIGDEEIKITDLTFYK